MNVYLLLSINSTIFVYVMFHNYSVMILLTYYTTAFHLTCILSQRVPSSTLLCIHLASRHQITSQSNIQSLSPIHSTFYYWLVNYMEDQVDMQLYGHHETPSAVWTNYIQQKYLNSTVHPMGGSKPINHRSMHDLPLKSLLTTRSHALLVWCIKETRQLKYIYVQYLCNLDHTISEVDNITNENSHRYNRRCTQDSLTKHVAYVI